ncbi:hypothetical protein GGF42_008917 [Coemansia sp. RSA 2424]|nr:hypothetical protein GGF42_008917 [Coemansia sp. RSA 2424]
MDNESSYWDQYDAYETGQSLPVAQPPPPPQLAPQAEEFRYAPYVSSCSASSRDSYWSRHLGTRPAGTNQQCTPGNVDSSSSNLRRLLVVPDKLAALNIDCAATSLGISGSGNSSDSGCDVSEYKNAQIVADNTATGRRDDDDATLVMMSAATPPPSLLLQSAGVNSSSHERNSMPSLERNHRVDLKPAPAISGRSQSDRCCADGGGPKNSLLVDPADHSPPPSSPGLCFTGVNANALITRLNFLKDQMEQDELLMSLVV